MAVVDTPLALNAFHAQMVVVRTQNASESQNKATNDVVWTLPNACLLAHEACVDGDCECRDCDLPAVRLL